MTEEKPEYIIPARNLGKLHKELCDGGMIQGKNFSEDGFLEMGTTYIVFEVVPQTNIDNYMEQLELLRNISLDRWPNEKFEKKIQWDKHAKKGGFELESVFEFDGSEAPIMESRGHGIMLPESEGLIKVPEIGVFVCTDYLIQGLTPKILGEEAKRVFTKEWNYDLENISGWKIGFVRKDNECFTSPTNIYDEEMYPSDLSDPARKIFEKHGRYIE